jgi:hypothetical protein
MKLKTACSHATVSARVCPELAAELSGLSHTGESGSLLNRRQHESASLPAQGGLRLSFTPRPEQAPLPELHAGDEGSVLTEADCLKFFVMKARSIGAPI